MTLQVIQTCDGCKRQRELKGGDTAMTEGWREVSTGKHLCAKCINRALAADLGTTEPKAKD
jgi:hypothetical protein